MNERLTLADLVVYAGEPTISDLRLAELLGFDRPRNIRKLIQRNLDELLRYGEVFSMVEKTSDEDDEISATAPLIRSTVERISQRGRKADFEYRLNQGQALLIAIKSEAKNAPAVREMLIRVFLAWYSGEYLAPDVSSPLVEIDLRYSPLGAKVDFLRYITKFRGFEAAVAYMDALGLPPLPPKPSAASFSRSEEGVLRTIMAATVGGKSISDHIALGQGDPDAVIALADGGIRFHDDGIYVLHGAPFLVDLFARTQWRDGKWVAALQKMPGAMMGFRFSMQDVGQTRATWLPMSALD